MLDSTQTLSLNPEAPSLGQKLCKAFLLRLLRGIRTGHLSLTTPDGVSWDFGDPGSNLRASLVVRDYNFFKRVVQGTDIGFGESYTAGEFESPDLTALIRLFIENGQAFSGGTTPWAHLIRARDRLRHWFRKNTLQGSRRNIRAHYDLSNDMFRLFLDPSMTYSCALFTESGQSLEQAQQNKRLSMIRKANISPSDHVLEIGCGWGSFAIEAVRNTGCQVTGITLSEQQLEYAQRRVQEQGLQERIHLKLCDYRDIRGRFDKIVSIEMLEAVGHEYLGAFFNACDRLLKPQGLVALQVITIPDQRYDAYRKSCDWIQKHIFPGALLPSLGALCDAMKSHSRFVVEHLENIADHYVRTLQEWRTRFQLARTQVEDLGFGPDFQKAWEYYFCYCEAAFAARALGDLQMVLGSSK